MKLVLLAPVVSHSIKWANSLADKGIEVLLIGYSNEIELNKGTNFKFKLVFLRDSDLASNSNSLIKIFSYLKVVKKVKKIISEFKPDIVHSHYATSYGFLGALTKFHPFILSFWGSDVYLFPKKSFLHRKLLNYNIGKTDVILSTSKSMANEIKKYTSRNIEITPFGIDLNKLNPEKKYILGNSLIIGTIKNLDHIYGIDILLQAFSLLVKNNDDIDVKLVIIGGGPEEKKLKKLAIELAIQNKVNFIGPIPFEMIPDYHKSIDIFAALSRSESFGVSVIEASACGKPVVVSNVGGLPEVVDNNFTGIVVPVEDILSSYKALEKLTKDAQLRTWMGNNGVEKVAKEYNWVDNVDLMIDIYTNIIKQKTKK